MNHTKVKVDNIFVYNVVLNVMNDNEDQESKSIKDCKQRND